MADPRNTNNAPKSPLPGLNVAQEAAVRLGAKDLVPQRNALKPTGGQEQLRAWMAKMGDSESAARMSNDSLNMDLAAEDPDSYLDVVAQNLGLEKVTLADIEFTPELVAEVPAAIAKKYGVVPVKATETDLWVALQDPHNVQALDDLNRILGKLVHGMVAREDEILRALQRHYESENYTDIYNNLTEGDDPTGYMKKYEEINLGDAPEGTQPAVVTFVDLIFRQAVHERASDIHIEPTRHGMTIRYRIDGVLQEIPSPPAKWVNAIISRLKVLSNMDLAEKRVPQDGRIRLTFGEKKLDLRVSNLPTIFGESIVMRILDQSQVMMGLEDVGFLPSSIKTFNDLIRSPNGVILMTGPTGSGKTTTLYAALGVLNTPDHKLVTLEDPVEYQIPGINQIQINQDIGLDFALGLRSVLRQSPDIILVGEIRDTETAENAIRAALTGHLVFSTLHTNDAPSSTVRLIDMGIKPYLVASSLQAAIAQRLVRRICPGCKESWRPSPEIIQESGYDPDEYANRDFFRGRGCERCNQHGYRGRTAIHEIMVLNSDLRRRIIRSEPASRLKKAAMKYGMRTLRMDGWEKCLLGSTTIDEVMSITADDVN